MAGASQAPYPQILGNDIFHNYDTHSPKPYNYHYPPSKKNQSPSKVYPAHDMRTYGGFEGGGMA